MLPSHALDQWVTLNTILLALESLFSVNLLILMNNIDRAKIIAFLQNSFKFLLFIFNCWGIVIYARLTVTALEAAYTLLEQRSIEVILGMRWASTFWLFGLMKYLYVFVQ